MILRSLITLGIFAGLASSSAKADFILETIGVAVVEDFNSFQGSGFAPDPSAGQLDSDVWSVDGFSDSENDLTSGDYARGISGGGLSLGGVYAFETSTGNFSLGVQPGGSDFTPGYFQLEVTNGTGLSISGFAFSYDTFVYNDQGRSNTLQASFSLDGSNFTELTGSLVTSDEAADTSVAWVSTNFSETVSLEVGAGESFFLRWEGDDLGGSGSRDEFSIDNVSVTAVPEPTSLAFAALAGAGGVLRFRRRRKIEMTS